MNRVLYTKMQEFKNETLFEGFENRQIVWNKKELTTNKIIQQKLINHNESIQRDIFEDLTKLFEKKLKESIKILETHEDSKEDGESKLF